jgi:predicted DNA-binding transcriptional regulator AlpA
MAAGIDLKPSEIQRAFDHADPRSQPYGPILDPSQVGRMLGYPRSTIYEWIAKGRFDGAYRKRGKGVRFFRDRVLHLFFNGPDWEHNE